jgi:putative peptide zinc metalloprotease protein
MEAQALWHLRDRLNLGRRTLATLTGIAGIVLLLLLPWRSSIEAPALLKSADVETVFAPSGGAQVTGLAAKDGAAVAQGATLVTLASPDLAHKLDQAKSDLALIDWQISAQGVSPDLLARSRVAAHEYEAALATYRSLADEAAKLTVTAPIAGRVVDIAEDLRPGQWVAAHERLLAVIEPDSAAIEAYISESDLARIAVGDTAVFYPESGWGEPVAARVTRIERANARLLAEPYLASRFGGEIPVREMKQSEWVPESAVYRVMLAPVGEPARAPSRVLRGRVVLSGKAESLALRAWRRVLAVAVRESGL